MLKKYLKRNRSHYLKWKIDEELSIRYYFKYENKAFEYLENNFVLKNHKLKTYLILTENKAIELLTENKSSFVPEEYFSLSGDNYEYIRLFVDESSLAKIIIEDEDF